MSVLTADGRALIVAMDHARTHGVIEGLENPGAVLETMIDAGADAIMTTFGVIKKYRNVIHGRVPTLMRLDGGPSLYREDWLAYTEWELLHSVEDAIMLGADGVVLMAFMGIPVELKTLSIVARVASECLRANLPLVVEALPCPSCAFPTPRTPSPWPRPPPGLRTWRRLHQDLLYRHAGVLRCRGGKLPRADPHRRRPQDEHAGRHPPRGDGAMIAGAAGVVFANMWQSPNAGVVHALKRVIHDRASVAPAMQELK